MASKLLSLILPRSLHTSPRQNPNLLSSSSPFSNLHQSLHFFPLSLLNTKTTLLSNLCLTATHHRTRFVTARVIRAQQLTDTGDDDDSLQSSTEEEGEDEELVRDGEKKKNELAEQSIWNQIKEIVAFTGPATGLWICGPLMSLIDTAVIGQGSSIELAALAFTGPKNAHIVSAANTYVQVVAAYMMIQALNNKGYNAYAFSIPSGKEFLTILGLAAPVFLTLMSKVAFYSLLIYFATSMGTHTMAAHQVMVQTFVMCTVWGEPLSQTAQSFMPELIYGVNRSLSKARMLLRSLVIIGATLGFFLGIVGTCVPWFFPYIFTHDQVVIQEMHKVLVPYFVGLAVTPPTHSLEGTLMAGRDLNFISLSMTGCLCLGTIVLWFLSSRYGLQGCWIALAGFQWREKGFVERKEGEKKRRKKKKRVKLEEEE
ncbi:hypothetical protein TanjilG_23454 [Lupinus angustifolius]|uniref:Protein DETOXIFICATION n=1 Tax=Lupinus angustifolius TaxID=3871 RepID=A0A4P1R9V3_LUPAN|nr:hypothetical protein TanjilG_23454 [Lupinus angustifolius]